VTSPRLKSAYYEPKAGEWQQPIRKGYRMACCDCGLVHTMNFRVVNGRAQFCIFRDNRKTAAMRRNGSVVFPSHLVQELAEKYMRATGKKSVIVGNWRIKLVAPKQDTKHAAYPR